MIDTLYSSGSSTPPIPPGKLHTPTYSPNGSPDSNAYTLIQCLDAGAHLFYTVGANPPNPTHNGDTPTGSTQRIGSNEGTVNSGDGQTIFKTLAYKQGMTDSSIAISNLFGASPVQKPILTGWLQLLPADTLANPIDIPGDIANWQFWNKPWIDGVRYRVAWQTLNTGNGVYDWTHLDQLLALCETFQKYLSISVVAGTISPSWIFPACYQYTQHDPNNPGTQPLPWDPQYQTYFFAFLDALKAHIGSNDLLRAMIDCGVGAGAPYTMGDSVDEVQQFTQFPAGYPDIHTAWRTAATAIFNKHMANFPHIGHATTFIRVWPDTAGQHDAETVANLYESTYWNTAKIVTSIRAQLPIGGPHPAPPPSGLSQGGGYGQEFEPMTSIPGHGSDNRYNPPQPDQGGMVTLSDCLYGGFWSSGKTYGEIYKGDVEFSGVDDLFSTTRQLLKANLLPPPPP